MQNQPVFIEDDALFPVPQDLLGEIVAKEEPLQELYNLISKSDSPGMFATGGALHAPHPGLFIEGFGCVGLPLVESEAQRLIGISEEYDLYKQTLKKQSLEIPMLYIRILNLKFTQYVNNLVQTLIAADLGLGTSKIAVVLDKIIISEPGRDSMPFEKQPGVFGSLIITLPSDFEGGDMFVSYQDMARTFSSDDPLFTDSYAAFYSDCAHKIQPVTRGYRLDIVYNLIRVDATPSPSNSLELLKGIPNCIKNWMETPVEPRMFVLVSDHKYPSKDEISFEKLQVKDRAISQILREAILPYPDLEINIARVHCWTTDHKDPSYSLKSVKSLQGSSFELDRFFIDKKVIFPRNPFKNADYEEKNVRDDSNEGYGTDRLYTGLAIVIWTKQALVAKIQKSVVTSAASYLKMLIRSWQSSMDPIEWQYCREVAGKFADAFKSPQDYLLHKLFKPLIVLEDLELIKIYLTHLFNMHMQNYLHVDASKKFSSQFKSCLVKYGDELAPWIGPFTKCFNSASFSLTALQTLLSEYTLLGEASKLEIEKYIKDQIQQQLEGKKGSDIERLIDYAVELLSLLYTYFPLALSQVFTMIKNAKQINVSFILKVCQRHPLLAYNSPELASLVMRCLHSLVARSNHWLHLPEDWTFEVVLQCNCALCLSVNAFLASPKESRLMLQIYKDQQSHIQANLAPVDKFHLIKVLPNWPCEIIKTRKESAVKRARALADFEMVKQLRGYIDREQLVKRQKTADPTNL